MNKWGPWVWGRNNPEHSSPFLSSLSSSETSSVPHTASLYTDCCQCLSASAPRTAGALELCCSKGTASGLKLTAAAGQGAGIPPSQTWHQSCQQLLVTYCTDLSYTEIRTNPETQTGPHTLNSISLCCSHPNLAFTRDKRSAGLSSPNPWKHAHDQVTSFCIISTSLNKASCRKCCVYLLSLPCFLLRRARNAKSDCNNNFVQKKKSRTQTACVKPLPPLAARPLIWVNYFSWLIQAP